MKHISEESKKAIREELKKKIEEVYNMCDAIEKAGVVKQPMKTSLRENLKFEFLKFLEIFFESFFEQMRQSPVKSEVFWEMFFEIFWRFFLNIFLERWGKVF